MLIPYLAPDVLRWYEPRRLDRSLPWRVNPSPYHTWISEIMLQQTRIEAVIPYYERFLDAFPTADALASADDERLMKLWEGLGYYSRARNLKKAAVLIARSGGELPADVNRLKKLPGIGDYTAGAIASIAFGLPEPAVDGNVLRVLSRIACIEDDVMLPETRAAVREALREQYTPGEPSSRFTEGLMELGQAVCIPNGAPKCPDCPVAHLCLAHQIGKEDAYPVKKAKKPRRTEPMTVLILRCGDKIAIRKRPDEGLLRGMWELPNVPGSLEETQVFDTVRQLGPGCEPVRCTKLPDAVHVFTHVEWRMTAWEIEVADAAETGALLWRTPDEIRADYALPTAFRKWQF